MTSIICKPNWTFLSPAFLVFSLRGISSFPTKSTGISFTNKNVKLRLKVKVEDIPIPTVSNSKVLDVTFDSLLSFSAHTTAIATKVNKCKKDLKLVAESKDQGMLLETFKAISRSTLNYAAPGWSPGTNDSQWTKLQTYQNTAIRWAIGYLLMSSLEHLHNETFMLSVKEHRKNAQQAISACLLLYEPYGQKFAAAWATFQVS